MDGKDGRGQRGLRQSGAFSRGGMQRRLRRWAWRRRLRRWTGRAASAGRAESGFGGGGRGGGRGGGGRRSDGAEHDIVLLGRLDDGLGYYRFVDNGGHTAYVGVMARGGVDRGAGSGDARRGR